VTVSASRAHRADTWIVVDLGFGDCGKGTIVDFLVRDREADLVVRFNGGAQAGHNVITADGRHHTFAQFGAGTFVPGVGTHLGPQFVLHPGAVAVEARVLERVGVRDALSRLTVDERAPVVTPFQQAAGRLRELGRGAHGHGTTGVGVGEVRLDQAMGCDDVVYTADLRSQDVLADKLERQRQRKREEMDELRDVPGTDDELQVLADRDLVRVVLDTWHMLRLQVLDPDAAARRIAGAKRLVMEGAQGVLLDQRWGFHPYTTWSDCTFEGAEALIAGRERFRLGVVRAYATRHGPGPFPSEQPHWPLPEPHNANHGWQGRFRVGALDGVLLRYATTVVGGVDGTALTCLDRIREIPTGFRVCVGYTTPDGPVDRLAPGDADDWSHREELGRRLMDVVPQLEEAEPEAFVTHHAGEVVLTSAGTTAKEKRWR
jgi:adenylosuccinate synthase